ncbi:ATP-binding protein [Mucilaginibacter galii]
MCGQPIPAVAAPPHIAISNQILDFFNKIFSTADFPARWHCGNWTDFHGWLYIVSDIAIWAAYFAIPFLLYRLLRKRPDIPFHRIFLFFIGFIMLCGLTHFADALIFWWPAYRFSALLRLATAVISLATVYQIYRVFPSILRLRSLTDLEAEIDKRKVTEERLAANEFLLSEAGRIACVGGWELDLVSGKRTWSKTVYDILELPYDRNIYEDDIASYYPDPYTESLEQAMNRAITAGEKWDLEVQTLTQGGKMVWVRHTGEPVKNETGEVIKLRGILMDIDRYKSHELALTSALTVTKEKKQQLKNFSYVLSHNIRNHTSNLSALTDMVSTENLDKGNLDLLFMTRQVTKALTTTLDDLADVIQARDQVMEQEILNLYYEISESLRAISTQFDGINIQISCNLGIPQVYFSKVYLQSIIEQLVSNAIRYRNTHKQLQLTINSYINDDGRTVLELKDNGRGIDLEKYGSKLFNLYTTFHNYPGARGVGLYLVKTQLESLGAQIEADSIPEVGSTFSIKFQKEETQFETNGRAILQSKLYQTIQS